MHGLRHIDQMKILVIQLFLIIQIKNEEVYKIKNNLIESNKCNPVNK